MNRSVFFSSRFSAASLAGARRLAAAPRRRGERLHRRQGEGSRSTPAPATARRSSTSASTARRPQVNFHSAPPPADLKKRRPADEAEHADASMDAAPRDERKSRLQRASARAARHRDPGPRAPLRDDAEERARIARSSRGASPRTTSSSSPPPSATRPRRRSSATSCKKTNAAARRPAADAGQPGRQRHEGRAQEGDRVLHAHRQRLPELRRSSTRSSTTSRTSTSRRATSTNARTVYYELIQKAPRLEVHPERVPRVRRALLQRGAGRSHRSGISPRRRTPRSSSTRRRTTRCTATPGTSSPTSSGTRASFDKALNAFKKTIDFGVAVLAAARTRRSSPTARAATSSPSTRSRAIPARPTTSSTTSRATRPASNEKTFKMMDDLGQNYLDTGHYPEAHRRSTRTSSSRDKRRQATASTRRTSPRRRWR